MTQSPFCCFAVDSCLSQSAVLVWGVTRAARSALHEHQLPGACRGPAPFGPDDAAARLPREACEHVGCIDLFMDVWTHAHAALHTRFGQDADPGLADAQSYLAVCARSRLAELNRQQRVARGGVAKPQRRDGTVGRIARCLGDPWLADLFRFLLGYVAAAGHGADGWPLDVLTLRKNAWDKGDRTVGSPAARAELRADVDTCLAVTRREAGSSWLYDCILLPLANRASRPAPLPVDIADTLPSAADDEEVWLAEAATAVLDDMLRRSRAGASPGAALRDAVDGWLGEGACPPQWVRVRADELALRRLAKSLMAELGGDEEAA
ncbi:MAG: hypothetical protein ACLPQY_20915 [Streptosporangiaceae bacterium]